MSVLTRFSHPLIMCKYFLNDCFALSLGFYEIVHGGLCSELPSEISHVCALSKRKSINK